MIPKQSAVWDEGRNTSRTRPPSPTALKDCLDAMRRLRETHPALCQWLADGHPHLTEAEHYERFGCSYDDSRKGLGRQ